MNGIYRDIGIFALTAYLLLFLRPRCMFDENGRPVPFGAGAKQTLIPFWMVAVIAALYLPGAYANAFR